MITAKQELVRNWLTKAQSDLASAMKLADKFDPHLDTAIYHCQQAAEKAIKAVLVFYDQPFEKTHEIESLIPLAVPFAQNLSQWLEVGERLTPYATMYRYPGESLEPTYEEFDKALKSAKDFYAFILSILPPDVHPQVTKAQKPSD